VKRQLVLREEQTQVDVLDASFVAEFEEFMDDIPSVVILKQLQQRSNEHDENKHGDYDQSNLSADLISNLLLENTVQVEREFYRTHAYGAFVKDEHGS
jgi:hypothetical protein